MKSFCLVTGSASKLAEWRRLMPNDYGIDSVSIDLPEIQSADSREIVADKAKRAYAEVGRPVVVEDISAGLESLGGMPGPFVKFFFERMGEEALYKLAKREGEPATVTCTIAYYDGDQLLTVRGDIHGKIVKPRGENGFGFDSTFMPDGSTMTYAELGPLGKDAVSHRAKAIKMLEEILRQH